MSWAFKSFLNNLEDYIRYWVIYDEESRKAHKTVQKDIWEARIANQTEFLRTHIEGMRSLKYSSLRQEWQGTYRERDYTAPNFLNSIVDRSNKMSEHLLELPRFVRDAISESVFDQYYDSVKEFEREINKIYPNWPKLN